MVWETLVQSLYRSVPVAVERALCDRTGKRTRIGEGCCGISRGGRDHVSFVISRVRDGASIVSKKSINH